MSEIKVNSIKGVSASAAAITVNNTDGTCTANLTNRTNKNLIINGDMRIAQRGTSSTTEAYPTIDRFTTLRSANDEGPTMSQENVAVGTTPYSLGFRKTFKVTNGNQTSGAQATSTSMIAYRLEAQDMATSGWNYTSSSSYITLSFWVKASVSQNYYFSVFTQDGTSHQYTMETGVLTADTWTKITKTIPGNTNLQFDTDTVANSIARGFDIQWVMFRGTNSTGTRPLNTWAALDGTTRSPDNTTTWYTTDNATFELTGVQLEVGSVATDFEHRSFAQELKLCSRYYQQWAAITSGGSTDDNAIAVFANFSSSAAYGRIPYLNGSMRTGPSITHSSNRYFSNGAVFTNLNYVINGSSPTSLEVFVSAASGNWTAGHAGWLRAQTGSGGQFALNAEL